MNVIIHNECHNEFKLFRTSSEILDRCLIDFHNFLDRSNLSLIYELVIAIFRKLLK